MRADLFIDTNILLYAITDDSSVSGKTLAARNILRKENWGWSVQVAQEFYVNATSPRKGRALSHRDAVLFLHAWLPFPLAVNDEALLLHALDLKARFAVSYWDAAILAAAHNLNCKTVLSEDLNHGQHYNDVRVINPFK